VVTLVFAHRVRRRLNVAGEARYGCRVVRTSSSTVPNAIAAVLLEIREETRNVPHAYFSWAEANPIIAMPRHLVFGGDIAPLTREVLRRWNPAPRAARTST
jgi:hypothetical protein